MKAFPSPESYKTFVDVFGGAAHILLAKPPYNHLEVYNDYCKDLVNFWMQCRNHPEELQRQIDSLPYARSLYEDWQESLFDGSTMNDMERATRWFYVLRSSVGGIIRKSKGNWGYSVEDNKANMPRKIRNVAEVLPEISERFQHVQIEHSDFEKIIQTYGHHRAFLYCDPPYIGAEFYYEGLSFTMGDHKRLAQALNNTPAQVALSYYPHEALDTLYPISKWRRVTWQTCKYAEKTRETRQAATELLLMNYPETSGLWSTSGSEVLAV